MVASTHGYEGEYAFRHCVVASTWAFEAQGPGSIPGGGAISIARLKGWRSNIYCPPKEIAEQTAPVRLTS
jgi:hypothetical protein